MLRHTLLLPALLLTMGCSPQPLAATEASCEDHPVYTDLVATGGSTLEVIVALVHDQRDNVTDLQDRLLAELEGTEHEIVRRSRNFPIITLSVGEAAFCRLVTSPLVEGMQENAPEPPATN